jgi:glutamate-1-semialdehyde 2,1-aminomutase
VDAVVAAARDGTSFGARPSARSSSRGDRRRGSVVERVRLVSSGTEAAMSAIRLARGFTRRDRILKFAGCYHGHVDALLAERAPGLATLGIPSSLGVPPSVTAHTIVAPYNDVAAAAARRRVRRGAGVHRRRARRGEHGRRPAGAGFPRVLRELCDASGALLVFDEVITGFRVARGGAQELYGVTPDLTILGRSSAAGCRSRRSAAAPT